MNLSELSISIAFARHADLLKEAERERRTTGLESPPGRLPALVGRLRSRWRPALDSLWSLAGSRRAASTACPE